MPWLAEDISNIFVHFVEHAFSLGDQMPSENACSEVF